MIYFCSKAIVSKYINLGIYMCVCESILQNFGSIFAVVATTRQTRR